MSGKPRRGSVTPAEFHVMRALWELGAGTVAAIHEAIPRRKKLAYNTVLTQVRLLHGKGYLQREAVGRAHVYRPRVDRVAVLRTVVRQLADNYFEGNADALARFLVSEKLATLDDAQPPDAVETEIAEAG